MIEIGRVCVKIAGRDAGLKCVVVDILDRTFVLIDGETRRKRCNILHLEPLDNLLDIQKGASHESIASVLKKAGIEARTSKPSQAGPKPVKKRKSSSEIRESKEQKKTSSKPKDTPKKKEHTPVAEKASSDAHSTHEHKVPKKAPSKKKKAE